MRYFADKQFTIISCALFLLAGFLLLPVYKFQINPDGIAYLSIAKHYGGGRWMEALNSCWPPLYSWLIAPFTTFVEEPLWVAKVYNILSGAGCLWISHKLFRHFKVTGLLLIVGMLVLAGFYLMWSFHLTTPDLLSVWIILAYSYLIVSGKFLQKPILIGLLGALAYFAKSYCFYFFAAHLTVQYLYYGAFKKENYSALLKNYLVSIMVFLLISGSWMYLLYQKYGVFTVSSASAWTHGMLKYPNLDCVNQFIPPPYSSSVFAWEDPPRLCNHQDWNLFDSYENFQLQVNTLKRNTSHFFRLQKHTGYFHLAGFILILGALLFSYEQRSWRIKKWREILEDPFFSLLPLILIYTFGYLLIFIEPRYVWMGYVLITIGSIAVLNRMIEFWQLKKAVMISVTFMLMAILFIAVLLQEERMLVPLQKLLTGGKNITYNGKTFYENSLKLKKLSEPGSSIVSWGEKGGSNRAQNWGLAYYTGWRHFGRLPMDSLLANQLIERYNIRIITVAGSDSSLPSFMNKSWKRLYPPIGALAVFKLVE